MEPCIIDGCVFGAEHRHHGVFGCCGYHCSDVEAIARQDAAEETASMQREER